MERRDPLTGPKHVERFVRRRLAGHEQTHAKTVLKPAAQPCHSISTYDSAYDSVKL